MIQLAQTCCQFTAARTWCSHYHNRFGSFDIWILAVAFLAYDGINIHRIAFGCLMFVYFDASAFQFVDKHLRCRLMIIAGDYHTVYFQFPRTQIINQTHNIHIISNPEVPANFVSFNIACIYTDNNFYFIFQFVQQFNLCILVKTRQYTLGMIITQQFSTEFQIELIVIVYTFQNIFGLLLQILFRIKPYFHIPQTPSIIFYLWSFLIWFH